VPRAYLIGKWQSYFSLSTHWRGWYHIVRSLVRKGSEDLSWDPSCGVWICQRQPWVCPSLCPPLEHGNRPWEASNKRADESHPQCTRFADKRKAAGCLEKHPFFLGRPAHSLIIETRHPECVGESFPSPSSCGILAPEPPRSSHGKLNGVHGIDIQSSIVSQRSNRSVSSSSR
jgi:hypothetical protein